MIDEKFKYYDKIMSVYEERGLLDDPYQRQMCVYFAKMNSARFVIAERIAKEFKDEYDVF